MKNKMHTITSEPEGQANCSIIWLHGLGTTADDFEDIVPLLQLPKHIKPRFIFPQAPVQAVTINQGMPIPAWYDVYHLDRLDYQDQNGIEMSQQTISMLIDIEIERGIKADKIVVAGFSQGGAMALQIGLRYHHTLAGIIALSGYLPLSHLLETEQHSANHNTPIFMAHGKFDPRLPYLLFDLSVAELKQHNYNVDKHSYLMKHEVCAEEIKDLSTWLGNALK